MWFVEAWDASMDCHVADILCADPEMGPDPNPENHKNLGLLCNTGLDPMKNHKGTKPA